MSVRKIGGLMLAAALLISSPVCAQFSQGWILGQVRDFESGQVLENVELMLKEVDGKLELRGVTDSAGSYRFLAIPPGTYQLALQKTGHLSYLIQSIRVQSAHASTADVELPKSQPGFQIPVVIEWQEEISSFWATGLGSNFDRRRIENLPSARNIWALLENQEPTTVTNRVDEGGITSGTIALAGSRGSSWTQNGYRLDGIDVTDPFDTGKPLIYPDYGSLEELQVTTAVHHAAVRLPGASLNLTSRRGGRDLHLQAEAYYLGEPFQSSHLDERLRQLDFAGAERFHRFGEGHFLAGGPAPRIDNWFYSASLSYQRLSKGIPEFREIPVTNVYSAFLRLDGNLGNRDSISVSGAGQIINHSHLGARRGVDPSATLFANDRFELVQAHWIRRPTDDSVWQFRVGYAHASPTDTFHHGIDAPNRLQLFTEEMAGAAPLEADSARNRVSLIGQGQLWRRFLCKSCRHLVDFGAGLEESLTTEERRVFQDFQLLYYPRNVASQVIEYNTPSRTKQRVREWSLFLDDHLRVGQRLFVRFGLLLDGSSTFLPAERSGRGTFVPERSFSGMKRVVAWTTAAPRASLALALPRSLGRARLYASYSRYYHLLPARYANYAHPLSIGGRVLNWKDRNADGQFQAGEEGALLRVFGGPYSSVDPKLRRPFTDEWGLGLDRRFGRLQLSARFFRRDEKRLIETLNIGVPVSAFTPIEIRDIGDDNTPGTSDDQRITVFNQNPATLGQDRFLLTNPPGFRSFYKGLDLALQTALPWRGFASVSFAAYKAIGEASPGNSEFENDTGVIGSLFDDPNTRLNARGRLFFDRAYVGKVAAYAQAPFGLQLGSVIKYFDGLPFGRRLVIEGLNQGPIVVMATPRGQPGGLRTQFQLTFDQRIGREFDLGRYRLSAFVDVFNLLNLKKNLREWDISGPDFPLRRPLEVQNPRVIRFGIRLET